MGCINGIIKDVTAIKLSLMFLAAAGICVAYSGEYSKMRVSLIKEVSHEQRKKQAKTECKEKTTA